jgi:ankyrin repeat protein
MAQEQAAMYFTDPRMQQAAEAIFMGDAAALTKALQRIRDINSPAPGGPPENKGPTLLILAVESNKIDLVRVLIEHGANPNYNPPRNLNALASSTWLPKSDTFYYLIQHGGDVNLKDFRDNPLTFEAATQYHFDEMWYLLDHGADINAKGQLGAPLIVDLSRTDQFEQIAKLIERGADYTIPDATGATVAFIAQDHDNVTPAFDVWRKKVIQMLKDRGVKFPVPHPPIWDPDQRKYIPYPGPTRPTPPQ